MKNNECEIQFRLSSGWVQTVQKKLIDGKWIWIQTTNGVERTMTAEQLLSHILPGIVSMQKTEPIYGSKPRVRVVVVPL